MKLQILNIFSLLLIAIISCTPKVVEQVVQEEPVIETPTIDPNDRPTPCPMLDDLGSEREETETAFVLYRDFIKAEDYAQAYPYWKTAYDNAPGSNGRIQYHFDDGVKIFRHYFDSATDQADKMKQVESVKSLYNKRKECFGDEGYLDGRLGFDLYYYFPNMVSDEELLGLFESNLNSKAEKADYFIMNPMAKLLYDMVAAEKIEVSRAGSIAQKMLKAIKYGSDNCGTDCDSWKIINSYAPQRLENLEGVKGLYDCNYYADKYYAVFQTNPTDCETINEAYRRMKWGQCPDSNPKLAEVASAKKTHCQVQVEDTQPGPLRQAFNAYESGNYNDAVSQFEAFVNSTSDVEKKAKYLLLIAKIYYRDIKNYPKSRAYAEKAAEVKPNWGDPYMLIGKLYASSGPLCGPGTGFDSQVVTWPAIDMFTKAKQVDPSVASEANKLINTYTKYMPSKEDIFQRPSVNEGGTYKVGCWINRSTKVRAAS